MWPRLAEVVIGLWLIIGPWVLSDNRPASAWPINETVCGVAIVILCGLSFWPRLSRAHLAEIPIGFWLLGLTFFSSSHPASALAQSNMLTALFLLNFAIIPSEASLPPNSWRDFHATGRQQGGS